MERTINGRKYEIGPRASLSGANLRWAYLGEADLSGASLSGADLRWANLGGANLGGANLRWANLDGANLRWANLSRAILSRADLGGADLRWANLRGANLSRANLRGANLSGANLSWADLGGANLSWANLGGANLGNQWIIQGGTRTDGHQFRLQKLTGDKVPVVCAGCRNFTLAEAQAWWESASYPSPALAAETRVIVRALVDIAHMRGLMKVGA